MFNKKNLKSLTVRTLSKMFRKLQTTSKSLIILPETRKRVKLGVNGDICWVQAAVSRGQCGITSPNVTLFCCARSFSLSLAVSCCRLVFRNLKKFLSVWATLTPPHWQKRECEENDHQSQTNLHLSKVSSVLQFHTDPVSPPPLLHSNNTRKTAKFATFQMEAGLLNNDCIKKLHLCVSCAPVFAEGMISPSVRESLCQHLNYTFSCHASLLSLSTCDWGGIKKLCKPESCCSFPCCLVPLLRCGSGVCFSAT